jgi:hypothetical protein
VQCIPSVIIQERRGGCGVPPFVLLLSLDCAWMTNPPGVSFSKHSRNDLQALHWIAALLSSTYRSALYWLHLAGTNARTVHVQAVTNFDINHYDAESIAAEELDAHVKGRTAVAAPSQALSVRTRSSKRVVVPPPGGGQAYAVEQDEGDARVGEQVDRVTAPRAGGGGDNDSSDSQRYHVPYDDDGEAQYSLLHGEQAGAVQAEGFLHCAMVGVELGEAAHENIAYGMTGSYTTVSTSIVASSDADAAAMMPQHLDACSLASLTTEQSYDHLFNGYDQLLDTHEPSAAYHLWPTLYSTS